MAMVQVLAGEQKEEDKTTDDDDGNNTKSETMVLLFLPLVTTKVALKIHQW